MSASPFDIERVFKDVFDLELRDRLARSERYEVRCVGTGSVTIGDLKHAVRLTVWRDVGGGKYGITNYRSHEVEFDTEACVRWWRYRKTEMYESIVRFVRYLIAIVVPVRWKPKGWRLYGRRPRSH